MARKNTAGEENATTSGNSNGVIPDAMVKALGGILSALVGTFALIGLSQGEISSVLRDGFTHATYVAALTAAALACFVLSFALAKKWVNYAVSLGLGATAFASVSFIKSRTPLTGDAHSSRFALWIGGIGLAVLLVGIVIEIVVNPDHNVWSLQPGLLIAGSLLFVAAIYGALRLEAWSQSQSDAQVDAKLTVSGKLDTLELTVHADRVSRGRLVDVVVAAHPRSASSQKTDSASARCGQGAGCVELADLRIPPDADGGTKTDRTVAFPLHPTSYDYVYVSADPCRAVADASPSVPTTVTSTTTPGCHGASATVVVDP